MLKGFSQLLKNSTAQYIVKTIVLLDFFRESIICGILFTFCLLLSS